MVQKKQKHIFLFSIKMWHLNSYHTDVQILPYLDPL